MRLRNLSLPEFMEYIQDKELFCLGAGRLLQDLFKQTRSKINIKAVLDNSKTKQLNGVSYQEKIIGVQSVALLPALIKNPKRTVILITASITGGGMELYEQINAMGVPDKVECFIWNFMMADPASFTTVGCELNFRLENRPLIPKKIHYCWFGGKEIPDWQKRLIRNWKEKCPDFEIVRWDESNYDVRQNKYIARAYDEGKWAFVSDYARKDIIYQYGGIYLDVDVEIIKPLNELLYQRGFFGIMPDLRVASGLGFGAIPKLGVIKELRDIYNNEDFIFTNLSRIKIAPDYETDILIAHGYEKNGNLQKVAQLTIYPLEVLSGTLAYSNTKYITKNTFSIHHYAGSWTDLGKARRPSSAMKFYEEVINANKFDNIDDSTFQA